MKHSAPILVLLLGVPCLHAQGLKSEFEMLEKRRAATIKELVMPVDKKFTEAADALAARAEKEGNPGLAARIRRERQPETAAKFRSDAFEDTYWKITEKGLLSMYRIEAGGVIEEVAYEVSTGRRVTNQGKWVLVDATHATYREFTLKVADGMLSRGDYLRWVPSDKATFYKYSAAKDMAAAMAPLGMTPP